MIIRIITKATDDEPNAFMVNYETVRLVQILKPESYIINYETKEFTAYFPDKPWRYKFDNVVVDSERITITI